MSKIAKIDLFVDQLENTISVYGTQGTHVKEMLGNSVSNNRTVSVNQLVNFLLSSPHRSERRLGKSLQSIYSLIRPTLGRIRREVYENNRTDAYDLSEFIHVVHYFQTDRNFRKVAGQVL
jgi:hypothetical protein